jgi:type I restriction enzyme S subunit
MQHYVLGDVITEISERENNPSNSEYERFVGLEHYVSGEVEIENYGSTANLNSAMKVFNSGDILVARRNVYLKRASVVYFDGLTSGDSIVLRPKNETIGRILPFILNTDDFWDYADQYSDGTMSKRLSPKVLKQYEFDLPDDNLEQLADILWAMVDVKKSYQRLFKQTDELVKSQFIEMFGDGEFPFVKLSDECQLITKGTTPTTLGYNFEDSGVNFVKIENISNDSEFLSEGMMYISDACHNAMKRSQLQEGDILFSIAGAIGRCAIVTDEILPANTNQALSIIRLNKTTKFSKRFLLEALKSWFVEDQYMILKRGAAQLNLSLKDIGNFTIPLPPAELQEDYVTFVEQSDKSKFELKQAIEGVDILIKSMIQQELN